MEHDLLLDQIFHSALHESVLLRAIRSVVDSGGLIIFHEQLLLDVLGKERLSVVAHLMSGCTAILLLSRYHVHLGHVSDYIGVVRHLFLAVCDDVAPRVLLLDAIDRHSLVLLSLRCLVLLLEGIGDA